MAASKVLTWNGVSSANQLYLIIGEIIRDPLGGIRTAFMEVPGVEGSWVFPQRRGMRKIAVEASISAPNKELLRQAMEDLSDWLDVEGQAKLTISDDPGIFHYATLESPELESEWHGLAKLRLAWTCQPYSLSTAITTELWQADVIGNASHSWIPDTGGLVYPVITITPRDGTLVDFELETNGQTLSYSGGLVSNNQTLTINSLAGVVVTGTNQDTELIGVYNPSLVVLQYVTGSFPELMPNVSNLVNFYKGATGTATLIDIVVTFRKKHRR